MSICRTTIMETHTKEDLDLMLADYIENFDSMFPEAELALSVRVSPTTWINNSVYADQDTVESTGSVFKVVIEFEFEKLVVDDSTPMSEGGLLCYGISAQPDFFPFIVPGTSTMDILKEIK